MIMKPCARCKRMITYGHTYCPECEPIAQQELKDKRDHNAALKRKKYNRQYPDKYRRFYNSKDWKNLSKKKLEDVMYKCEAKLEGCSGIAVEAHHTIPIQTPEGWKVRLEYDLLEATCTACHNKRHPEKFKKFQGAIDLSQI